MINVFLDGNWLYLSINANVANKDWFPDEGEAETKK